MAQLTLHFAHNAGKIELEKTSFRSSSGEQFIAVRGKTGGAYGCTGSFQWTPAVKAVCVFFLQALRCSRTMEPRYVPMISGRRGSLASSLDYAINKEPQWLCDMFGLDAAGKTNLRRLIFRSNTNIKRPGPVSLSLNRSALPPENVMVFLDSVLVETGEVVDTILSALLQTPLELVQSPTFGPATQANSVESIIHPLGTTESSLSDHAAHAYA